MQLARFGVLWALAAAPLGCGGVEGAKVAGSWSGTMTDNTGVLALSGNCNQRDDQVRCLFSVTDAARGTSPGSVTAVVFGDPGSPNGSLSYALGIPEPCRIYVSGDADITPGAIVGTYKGINGCAGVDVRDGRLSLARP